MTVMSGQEITEYVARVRAALADLPADVRRELLEDLPEHLAEVGHETGGSLTDRLGPPEAYAAELRAAAGLPSPVTRVTLDDRAASAVRAVRDRLGALDVATGPLLGYARGSEFLRLLQPAWWVLRGYLAVLALAMVGGGQLGVVPRIGDSSLAALPLLALAVLGSIWLGRRAGRLPRVPRLVVNLAGALIVLIGLAGVLGIDARARSDGYYTPSYNDNPYSDVQDLYVYDGDGRLMNGVRVFDQDGRPVELGNPYWCPEAEGQLGPHGDPLPDRPRYVYPFCPQQAPFRGLGAAPSASADNSAEASPTATGTGPASTATPPGAPAAPGAPPGPGSPDAPDAPRPTAS